MNKEQIKSYLDYLIPDPRCELNYNKDYELLIAVMLSARTTDKRVNKVTSELFKKYDSLEKLKNANIDDVEKMVRELGSFRKKAKAVVEIAKVLDEKYNGVVPKEREELEKLSMVGRKTTNVILAILFDIPNIAVDTHVARVSKRLGLAKETDDVLKIENKLKKTFAKKDWIRIHNQFVLFGRYYCLAKKPKCDNCGLKKVCKASNLG